MSKEAMKLALEALENTTPTGFNMERDKQFFAAITALREALAEQPAQQEPEMNADISYIMSCSDDEFEQVTGIRLPEDAWERWSNNMDKRKNELLALFEKASQPAKYFDEVMYDGSSTAAALKRFQENVQPAPVAKPHEQEPVAWVCYGSNNKHDIDFFEDEIADLAVGTKLYTQAQRTWVGLTPTEKHELRYSCMTSAEFIDVIEAKLKEKNT